MIRKCLKHHFRTAVWYFIVHLDVEKCISQAVSSELNHASLWQAVKFSWLEAIKYNLLFSSHDT